MTQYRTLKQINKYLNGLLEVLDESRESEIGEAYPFRLHFLGSLEHRGCMCNVYEFKFKNQKFFVTNEPQPIVYMTGGMTLDDFQLQQRGAEWLYSQQPVALDTSMLGDDTVPRVVDRKRQISEVAQRCLGAVLNSFL